MARLSRPETKSVAGFNLTFSPVMPVSALWALAEPATAAAIERAHQKAVSNTTQERKPMSNAIMYSDGTYSTHNTLPPAFTVPQEGRAIDVIADALTDPRAL